MTELKPCPFCGVNLNCTKPTGLKASSVVRGCGANPVVLALVMVIHPPHLFDIDDSTRYAVENWNARAERTCRWSHDDYHDESNNIWTTECGERFSWESFGHPKRCPNCGAKVVSE